MWAFSDALSLGDFIEIDEDDVLEIGTFEGTIEAFDTLLTTIEPGAPSSTPQAAVAVGVRYVCATCRYRGDQESSDGQHLLPPQ